jgi:hypothetical protein
MKIAAAAVTLESSHLLAERHEESERLRSWRGARPDFEGAQRGRALPAPPPPQLSAAGKSAQAAEAQAIERAGDAVENDPFLLFLRTMIEWLTGEPVKIFDASQMTAPSAVEVEIPQPPPAAVRSAGFGIEYDYHALHEEFEHTNFTADGIVKTADGREIAFRLDLSMTRHFRTETSVSVRAGDARRTDPLVINFNGTTAQLSSQRFRFDLDADGRAEDVPLLAGGSGYLALDLNGNGRVDSGAELFGPASGSGFAELAAHDDDGNGWIDENDAVFERLQVWTPAVSGAGTLAGLAARGVGALYLAHAATPFELRGGDNADLGAVRDRSIYLTEVGAAGPLQEIDLTV